MIEIYTFYKKLLRYLKYKDYRFQLNSHFWFYKTISDEKYLRKMFFSQFGKHLNLDNPKTFNEKMQWLKLYDRKPLYTIMVDKYAVKEYVANLIGEEYIIPTYGLYNSFDKINFDKLPEQFVLKCTHDSGSSVIVRDKNKLDKKAAKKKLEKSLKRNYFYSGREWPYRDVPPRILIEKYMESGTSASLTDYKIYTFNGVPKIMGIYCDRPNTKAAYFDKNFNFLNFTWGYPSIEGKIDRPQNFDKMFCLAEILAKGTLELRVDFYEINGKIYFGELTFFDGAGFDKIEPPEWDKKLGDMLILPRKK